MQEADARGGVYLEIVLVGELGLEARLERGARTADAGGCVGSRPILHAGGDAVLGAVHLGDWDDKQDERQTLADAGMHVRYQVGALRQQLA